MACNYYQEEMQTKYKIMETCERNKHKTIPDCNIKCLWPNRRQIAAENDYFVNKLQDENTKLRNHNR